MWIRELYYCLIFYFYSPTALKLCFPSFFLFYLPACLTCPLKMALRVYVAQRSSRRPLPQPSSSSSATPSSSGDGTSSASSTSSSSSYGRGGRSGRAGAVLPPLFYPYVDRLPGRLTDRKSPLGELNWIFTSVTDAIAWAVLPRPLFLRLFRQDPLCASLLRNFLLAGRLMGLYGCTPVSYPALPDGTADHPLWAAWDGAVEAALAQLPQLLGYSPAEVSRMERLGLRPDLSKCGPDWGDLCPPLVVTPTVAVVPADGGTAGGGEGGGGAALPPPPLLPPPAVPLPSAAAVGAVAAPAPRKRSSATGGPPPAPVGTATADAAAAAVQHDAAVGGGAVGGIDAGAATLGTVLQPSRAAGGVITPAAASGVTQPAPSPSAFAPPLPIRGGRSGSISAASGGFSGSSGGGGGRAVGASGAKSSRGPPVIFAHVAGTGPDPLTLPVPPAASATSEQRVVMTRARLFHLLRTTPIGVAPGWAPVGE